MRPHLLCMATLVCLGFGVAGCAQSQDAMDSIQNAVHDFNPFGTAKQPLPGERKALFPEGVPGVEQGVPQHLVKGAQGEPEVVTAEPEPQKPAVASRPRTRAAAAPPPERERPARRPTPRTTPSPASAAPGPDTVWPEPPRQAAQRPVAPAPQKPAAAPPAQAGWAPPAQSPVPTQWPDPPQAKQ